MTYVQAQTIVRLQAELSEQLRLLEQARTLVDKLMNEPYLCDHCRVHQGDV